MCEYEKRHLYEALTRWNYFPNQKDGLKELPPFINSRQFTPEIAKILREREEKRKGGYGLVEYRSTRFNNVPRILGLTHPRAHAEIVNVFDENWPELEQVYSNKNSIIRPEAHPDGRAFIMNYENYETKVCNMLSQSFGKRFRAHTDIANCFGSIYTHSTEWAIRGLEETKRNMALKKKDRVDHWSQYLDEALRLSKRNETQGIAIGPATSSLTVELILGAVDSKLVDRSYNFLRYVDDYTCFCSTHEEAQAFLRDLEKELSKYKLALNLNKTSIVSLPEPLQPAWVSDLMRTKPSIFIDDEYSIRKLSLAEVVHYFDYAVRLNNSTPDGSVLKFAVSSVIRHVEEHSAKAVRDYILNLAWHYPILLPFIDELTLDQDDDDLDKFSFKVNEIAIENAKYGRSDGMAWSLYFLIHRNLHISKELIEAVIRSGDCTSISLLTKHEQGAEYAKTFALSLRNLPPYQLDEYWLLLYQLHFNELIDNFYPGEVTFEILKHYSVNFLPNLDDQSPAENYSALLSSGFFNPMPPFEEWLQRN